jgi:hypothetical protein
VDFPCDGLQADPILWDRNGNAMPDLLMLAVDRTMAVRSAAPPARPTTTGRVGRGSGVFTLSGACQVFCVSDSWLFGQMRPASRSG